MTFLCDQIFQQSLFLLRKKNPSLALELSLFLDFSSKINGVDHKENNASLLLKKKSFFLHAVGEAQKEADQQFSSLNLENKVRILSYGCGLGYFFNSIQTWLKQNPKRQWVIFEDQLAVLRLLLSTELGYQLLSHPQVELFYPQSTLFWETKRSKVQKCLALPFLITALPSYQKHKRKAYEDLHDRLISMAIDQNIEFAEYLYTAPLVFENALHNLLRLPHARNLLDLKNAFKGKPAIICGAGPSLNEEAATLSQLQDKALIFAGGRALSVLNDCHIEPHFSIGVDPYFQHKLTYQCNNYFQLPLIFRSRMCHQAVSLAHGPLLYTPGAIGYPFVKWLEELLGLFAPTLEEGLNVVNFNLQIAHYLGCSPLILVGCDLAYTEKAAYSSSIPDEQNLPDWGSVCDEDLTLNRGTLKKDRRGKPLYTLWKWTEEAKWIENFAKKHPALEIYNATSYGLPIKGLKELSLAEIETLKLQKSFDLRGEIHSLIQMTPLISTSKKEILKSVQTFYKSLIQCKKCLQKILGLFKNQRWCQEEVFSHLVLLEYELFLEPSYSHLLSSIERLFERVEIEKEEFHRKQKKYLFLEKQLEKYTQIFSTFLNMNLL